MTNWSSVSEIANEGAVLTHLIFVLFGLYVWEILMTLGFEWSLITKARKFSWPLVSVNIYFLFFLCRYSLVGALIGMIVSFQINCQALYTWNSISGNLAILAASTSLLLRTIALWNRRKIIIIVLGTLCLGHWAILLRGMFLIDAQYSAEAQGCVVTSTNHIFLNVSFFTTMGVDFVVLCFTIAALARQEIHSGLWKLLFKDGLAYFCITFLCNAVPAILNVLNLNGKSLYPSLRSHCTELFSNSGNGYVSFHQVNGSVLPNETLRPFSIATVRAIFYEMKSLD
ncbi:hypothetical protein BDY19DRAFT_1024657 [Irpex rosettiformis]|uniref:Uncharacterized protein n=1 Tax=Irpex rosettiformis TaxID=378272 RepID=A0ACB8UES1_9APHY|nr:hypothetical protein BDY19DRAFT_1024657 [Irpex rosettiformis]